MHRALTPLVQTYGTVPYADLDPTWLAWASYVLMFGIMFGDAGQGLLLVGVAVALRAGWPRWARRFRAAWPFVGGAGVAATVFGLLYGECFGPTGLVPAIWISPLGQPVTLLLAAAGIGAILLAGAYALGTVNRWREGGWPSVLYAPSGIAGSCLFLGAAVLAGGWYIHQGWLLAAGGAAAVAGLALAAVGFLAAGGRRGHRRGAGVGGTRRPGRPARLQRRVVHPAGGVRSHPRGARPAGLGGHPGAVAARRACWPSPGSLVFAAGTALAFSLEALVAAIQALRLEYYELFSRVFVAQGRPFRPWHVPTRAAVTRPVALTGFPHSA